MIEWEGSVHLLLRLSQAEKTLEYKAKETTGSCWLEIPLAWEKDYYLVGVTTDKHFTEREPSTFCFNRDYIKNKAHNSVLIEAAGMPISILSLVLDVILEILTKHKSILAKEQAEDSSQAKINLLASPICRRNSQL